MKASRLILHIGAPKCASTALQSACARAVTFSGLNGEEFSYGVIDARAALHTGLSVRRRALRSLSQAARCASAARIGAAPDAARAALSEHLNDALKRASVILSNEGWLSKPAEFAALPLLSNVTAPIEVIAFVRPQVDYLNAAWWQWGAWTGLDFNDWMASHLEECRWGSLLQAWAKLPNVARVTVRLLSDDVIADFFALLACAPPKSCIANQSLPAEALRLMQANPHLRAGPHDSNMPFVLGRALHSGGPTPWVLSIDFVAQVIEGFQADNRLLHSMLDAESQVRMDADARWWRADTYAHKGLAPLESPPASAQASEALAVALAQRLLEVERELAALKARLVGQPLSRNKRA